MKAEEFTEWTTRIEKEAGDLLDELAELGCKQLSKAFGTVLIACLEIEKQRTIKLFMQSEQATKSELKATLKAFDAAMRLVNTAITKE